MMDCVAFGDDEGGTSGGDGRVSVIIATRNRRDELCRTLGRLLAAPERPPIIVVDNGSDDGAAQAASAFGERVVVLAQPLNLGAAGRNVGVERAFTPYVAFADDDSWWAPGALARAADLFDAHPDVGLIAGRILVGEEEELDPVCEAMACSPLASSPGGPGVPILGFVACGAVVRRDAFLAAGGFERRFGVGGEEELLALDLASRGWRLVYAEDVVAHHHPSSRRDSDRRRRVMARNALWTTWLRRRGRGLWQRTAAVCAAVLFDAAGRRGVGEALVALPWVARFRRPLPVDVEEARRLLG